MRSFGRRPVAERIIGVIEASCFRTFDRISDFLSRLPGWGASPKNGLEIEEEDDSLYPQD